MREEIRAAVTAVRALGRIAEIIMALQNFTRRDLKNFPPGDTEKLGENLGVGGSNLDRFIRPWINRTYRAPDGKDPLPPGTIKATNTFKELRDFARAES